MSEQTDNEEKERIAMADLDSKASFLFVKEPYKWEILFQSVSGEIIKGDYDSISAMRLLLSTINTLEKEKILDNLERENLFDKFTIGKLKDGIYLDSNKKRKPLRFLKILFAIFTNPYGIVIKREKNHVYEKTGSFINNLKNKRFYF